MSDTALRMVDPAAYAEHGYPHEIWRELRREAPLSFHEAPGWPSFWAVTKHADIVEISKQPDLFLNAPGMTLVRTDRADQSVQQIKTVINMDQPEHRKFRAVASPYFSPRAIGSLQQLVSDTARKLVDDLGEEGECDFITEIASLQPLKVIARILGVSRGGRAVHPPAHQRTLRQRGPRVPARRGPPGGHARDVHGVLDLLHEGDGGTPSRAARRPGQRDRQREDRR